MKNSYINDTVMNANLHNGGVSSGIFLLNSRTVSQDNSSSNLNDINMGVLNGDVNGDYCYMNSYTGSESKNKNSVYYTKK